MKINNITIVGGGSAGWMSAALLIKRFPHYNISVIESPDVPIVGVGESTLLNIRDYCHILDIDEKDFMAYTDASYKMSIKFTDFYEINDGGYHYPFGELDTSDTLMGEVDWFVKKAKHPSIKNSTLANYLYPSSALYESCKFSDNKSNQFEGWDPHKHTAFHFDATKFGAWLRERYCIPRGVTHIPATVVEIKTDDNGISELVLNNGNKITSDLFIDCTGFKSLLLGETLGVEFNSYSDMLPNNRAWATRLDYKDKERELEPYTNSTALGNGWVWNIPLWSRLGTGYVYSDAYATPEEALEEFKQHLMSDKMIVPRTREEVDALEFKDIKMRVGIHEKLFVKNVVAIGLSAGFIEPLESNGLFSVLQFLDKLAITLESGKVNQFDKDTFNYACFGLFQNFAEFVALHYSLSARDDTPYWKANNDRVYDKTLNSLTATTAVGFRDFANRTMFEQLNIRPEWGICWISTGMNHLTLDSYSVDVLTYKGLIPPYKDFEPFFMRKELKVANYKKLAERELSLSQYLSKYIHN
jgi:flavin-dependent dehydrogenase